MDAACAASALVGLLFNCATAVKQCNDLRGNYKNADRTLRSIATEASTLRTSIHQLQHLMLRDPAALSTRWDMESMLPQTFETAIEAFNKVLEALFRELEKFDGKAGQSLGLTLTRGLKIKLLWNESAMQDILVQLRAQQQSLQFLLTILQMGTMSDIRNAVHENQYLLRKIERSTHSKRKLRSVEEEEVVSRSDDEDSGENNTSSDSDFDREPPAKRRSLSPEQEESSGSVSPPRTRSGKIYHPTIGVSASSVTSSRPAKESNRASGSTAKPTSSHRKQQQVTSSSQSQNSDLQRQARRQNKGRYGLGRSHSPTSSSLSSPLMRSSTFTYTAEASSPGWPGSSKSVQVHASEATLTTPASEETNAMDNTNSTKEKQSDADQPLGILNPGLTDAGITPAGQSTLTNPEPEDVEMCMDPRMTSNTRFSAPQDMPPSKTHDYHSPQVNSDSEDEAMDAPGKASTATQNDPSPSNSTMARPDTNEDQATSHLAEKAPKEAGPENPKSTDIVYIPGNGSAILSSLLGNSSKPYYSTYQRGPLLSQYSAGRSYPKSAFTPRYSSSGFYATAANASRKNSTWTPRYDYNQRNSFSHRGSYGALDDDDEYEYVDYLVDGVIYRMPTRKKPAKTTYRYLGQGTNPYYYSKQYTPENGPDATPYYEPPPRLRRRSSSRPPRPTSGTPKPQKKTVPIPKATEADARKHHIPPGYSLKNWDPTEEPIMLLGSVFDANSLGKWIYDWTVYHHGPATPIADMAGELWLLLIQLAGKTKRAEECMPRIRAKDNQEMIDDFIESGERLTGKLKRLLKSCETPMLKAGKKLGRDGNETALLGKNAGTEFVDSIFGRDRQLDATEKFMASIRLWNLRFDANCEDILRQPRQ
ncbi:hypothetical protein N431DRAFT_450834 [Stipitochalara longipes BDJ]|nr:hypothetical protein N431DRAFT_450834 [Stipitochalara longipes BDJ]